MLNYVVSVEKRLASLAGNFGKSSLVIHYYIFLHSKIEFI